MSKYYHADDGEWFELIDNKIFFACCDCALVHELRFTVVKGKPFISFIRDDRKTAAMRRHNGVPAIAQLVSKSDTNIYKAFERLPIGSVITFDEGFAKLSDAEKSIPHGVAARDIEKGESVTYSRYKNTDDIIVKLGLQRFKKPIYCDHGCLVNQCKVKGCIHEYS